VKGCVPLVVCGVTVGARVFDQQLDDVLSAGESTRTGQQRSGP
jgi:hypothetical protein